MMINKTTMNFRPTGDPSLFFLYLNEKKEDGWHIL